MTKKEIINRMVKEAKITSSYCGEKEGTGGQRCGSATGVILTSKEWGFEIYCNHSRSWYENKKLAVTLFELYLDEVIQPHTYDYDTKI